MGRTKRRTGIDPFVLTNQNSPTHTTHNPRISRKADIDDYGHPTPLTHQAFADHQIWASPQFLEGVIYG